MNISAYSSRVRQESTPERKYRICDIYFYFIFIRSNVLLIYLKQEDLKCVFRPINDERS